MDKNKRVSLVTLWSLCAGIVLGVLGIYELLEFRAHNIDLRPPVVASLPGPNSRISPRSARNIEKELIPQPHVLGAWVAKLNYEKQENPVIWYKAKTPEVDVAMKNYAALQLSGRGFSSAELNQQSQQSLRNSEDAKYGIIACGALSETNLPKLSPELPRIASGVCRASIPPFSNEVNLALVVVVDTPMTNNTPESIGIRRALLQLQLDIFNRDYLNREIEIHPID